MNVKELNRDQLVWLKVGLLLIRYGLRGEYPSWSDITEADNLVADEEVFKEFADIEFSEDDFC
jgi:hypothetical protein